MSSANNYIIPVDPDVNFNFRENWSHSIKILGSQNEPIVVFHSDHMVLSSTSPKYAAKEAHAILVKGFISFGHSTFTIESGYQCVFKCSLKSDGYITVYEKLRAVDRQFLKHLAIEIRKTMLAEAIVKKKINLI